MVEAEELWWEGLLERWRLPDDGDDDPWREEDLWLLGRSPEAINLEKGLLLRGAVEP
jgi:hypothetical protein